MEEKHVTLWGPIILGIVLIIVGLVANFNLDHEIIGGILTVLGALSAGIGIKGKIETTTKTVQVKESVPEQPQPVRQNVRKTNIVRKEITPPFTRNELQKIFDVLTQVDKIARAI